ncbi:MAG: hypothetical protein JO322_13065 [Candidatus Eremiobacteraeota bacterium]|nr:hypothetical protein [Candidatus Eremiobacteraeota bacterium]
MSAHALEVRMAHLEGAYEQINHRLGTVEQRLAALEVRVDTGFARVDECFTRLESRFDQRFMWIIGVLVVSILLTIVERFVAH